ncbi:MAG: nucleotide pyrophosphohydrolase [Myxococcota bacterium]|nr:nucleotide pyrophosphohydrolase [Myxococcota bacterium]MEC8424257.1 nucleotide pyrophosphohydrolase [Myxococcota bacterium]
MDVATMQQEIDAWIQENGGYWPELSLLARLTEEVGELAREYNHRFGPKKKKPTEGAVALDDEMADVLWILLCMANQQGIDLGASFQRTMDKVVRRDTGRFSED